MDFNSGGVGGGGLLGRIAALAPDWNPFPILQQLDQQQVNPAMPAGVTPGTWDWMNPAKAAGPLDPSVIASGPMAGIRPDISPLPTPPAANVSAPPGTPLTPQQLTALRAMMPQGAAIPPHFAPAVAPSNNTRSVQVGQLSVPAGTAPRPSFAQILGR